MERNTYYQILGVSKTAKLRDIMRAHRRLARIYHPDVNKDPEAEGRFREVSEAYETLGDPDKRAAYDKRAHQLTTDPRAVVRSVWEQIFEKGIRHG